MNLNQVTRALASALLAAGIAICPGQGDRSQTKPVTVSVGNNLFTVGGVLTGNGTVQSPAGSILANATKAGIGTFNFSLRYATLKKINGTFTYAVESRPLLVFSFAGASYNWMHVGLDGTNMQVRGTATVNGNSGYDFLLTVHSGGIKGTAVDADYFRLQVMHTVGSTTVMDYDNLRGKPDSFFIAGNNTARVTGGKITIKS